MVHLNWASGTAVKLGDGIQNDAAENAVTTKTGSFAILRKWFSRSSGDNASGTPETGAVFAHMSAGRSVELARVIDVATDELGIRHVRFHLAYRYQHKIMEAGERTLAMHSFTARFTNHLQNFPD